MNAAAISRVLASAGVRPLPSGTPHSRQGIRVRRAIAGIASVRADYDSELEARRAIDVAHEILADAGFLCSRVSDHLLRVERKVPAAPTERMVP